MDEKEKKQTKMHRLLEVIKHHPFVVVAVTLTTLLLTLFILKTSMPVAYIYTESDHSINEPLRIKLSQKLRNVSVSSISIEPKIEGKWKFSRGPVLGSDELSFQPVKPFRINTKYTIVLPEVDRMLLGDDDTDPIIFTTEGAPDLASTGVADFDDDTTVPADHEFVAKLTSSGKNLRDLELKSEPKIKFDASIDSKYQTYKWTTKDTLPQGKTLKLTVYDRQNEEALAEKTIHVASAPRVKEGVSPTHFTPDSIALIKFDQPIEASSEKYIKFALPGKGTWRDSSTYAFTPEDGAIKPGKTYTYVIKKGLRTEKGGILTKDLKANFSSTGAVTVSSASPWGRQLSQAHQIVKFTFDQKVDKKSAQQRFSISSGKIESYSWQGNTLSVSVKKLGYQRSVTATIKPGVINTGFGLPSNRPFSVTFTTEFRQRRLSVPFYNQQHSATCTAATLRMALAYRGIHTSEMNIVNKMGYSPTKMDKSKKPATWDDPALMFVGHVDGSIRKGTGAGPDAPPIAKASVALGRNASAVTGASATWIAKHIYNGNPVIMFGATSSTGFISWKTPSGSMAKMNLTSHVVTVTGVVGEPHNPIGFWINDPLAGGPAYWTAGQVSANLSRDIVRQAVVIY